MSKNKIYYKNEEEIELLRASNLIVSKTLALVGELLKPGITGVELDKKAESFINDHGGVPSFKGYEGFPNALCISINEAIVHGIPNNMPIRNGDIISVDCGVLKDGFHGDSAFTFAMGEVEQETLELCFRTRKALYLGIEKAVVGNRIGDISCAIQKYAERECGYGVVRELVGHGIGKQLHEPPMVPNFGRCGKGVLMKEGLAIAIEPMVNLGTKRMKVLKDGWTVITRDRKPSAHYEHTVVVRKNEAQILSDHAIVDESVKNNGNLREIEKII